jgi:hypothetical protein
MVCFLFEYIQNVVSGAFSGRRSYAQSWLEFSGIVDSLRIKRSL